MELSTVLAFALGRISRRSPRFGPIAGSEDELKEMLGDFENDFLTFYPEAMSFAEMTHRRRRAMNEEKDRKGQMNPR